MLKFNSGQKLLQFQFWKFGRIPHKFADKNEVLSMGPITLKGDIEFDLQSYWSISQQMKFSDVENPVTIFSTSSKL